MSKCSELVFPGDVLKYTNSKSSNDGAHYLVTVRCGGKDRAGATPDNCTFPVLTNLATGFARKGSLNPPRNMPRKDWRDYGIPLVDVVGSKAPHFTKASIFVGEPLTRPA